MISVSERFDHYKYNDCDQGQYRCFIEPAIPYMGVKVFVLFEVLNDEAATEMVDDEQSNQDQFKYHPVRKQVPGHLVQRPDPKQDGKYRTGCHDSIKQLPFHDFEASCTGSVL